MTGADRRPAPLTAGSRLTPPGGGSKRAGSGRRRAGYSRFVGLMKVGLMGLAILLVALVVLWPQIQTVEEEFKVKFASLKGAQVDQIEMLNARYFGTDQKNRPYAVTAAKALELDEDRVELDYPKADMSMDRGWAMLSGDKGYYSKGDKTLLLVDNVNLFQEEGNEFHTTKARIQVETGDATGQEPVEGAGSFGWVKGEGFELTDKGKRLKITGQTKLVLTGAKPQEGQ